MRVGIVGVEDAKLTPKTRALAREVIGMLLERPSTILVSGGCHLGGIDILAEEVADALGRKKEIQRPISLTWEDRYDEASKMWLGGFKTRNQKIATLSDIVHCITVTEESWSGASTGHAFKWCYHCRGKNPPHIKSGGCWTAWRCPKHQWWIL